MNKLSSVFLFLVSSFICFSSAEAYVHNRTDANALVHWSSNIDLVTIFVNPANSLGYSTSLVEDQVAAAVNEWSGKSRINLEKNTTAGTNQDGLNEIYFSNDATVFGIGVVGVTQVYFKNDTGEILEADILINDSYSSFSTNINSEKYLGNVITHELGHLLGLGHSQVNGSSMFYSLSRGQNAISDDDKAGIYSIYPNGDSTKGVLSGKIIGGRSLVGVFAAQVQAISLKSGRVAGAAISDTDGTFVINGLDQGDQYYIYTSPSVQQVGLPAKYNNARYDFCDSSKKYRGSFFQSCSSSQAGYPQAVKLNSSQVNVGNITIRCDLDVPANYLQSKNLPTAAFDIQNNVTSGVGNSFAGYFSSVEINNGSKDYFRMNFSNIDWNSISATGDLYVELKVLNQAFYSPYKAEVSVSWPSGSFTTPIYSQESDGWLNLESVVRLPINRGVLSDNNFEITVSPLALDLPSGGQPYYKSDYFPSSEHFEDSLMFYLVSASIVKDNGNGTYSLVSYKNVQQSDNTSCPDAVNTYALSSFTVKRSVASNARKKDEGIACGTVDMSAGPGNGPGGFFIGLIFSLLLCSLTSSIIRNNGQNKIAR